MAPHARLDEMSPDEVWLMQSNFIDEMRKRKNAAEGAVSVAEGRLSAVDPASAEYALMVAALAGQEEEAAQRSTANLMRFIAEIRPPSTGGRPNRNDIPERFGGMWPHERLGHKTWRAFVAARRRGEIDPETRTFREPPGLGWRHDYEKKLWKGYMVVSRWVEQAEPDEAKRATVLDAAVDGAGVKGLELMGEKGVACYTLSADDAREAVTRLAEQDVSAEDIRARGAEALTGPRQDAEVKRRREIESLVRKVRKWPPQDVRELVSRLEHEVMNA